MRSPLLFILLLTTTEPLAAQDVKLPLKDGSIKFAVIGDTGTGGSDQYAIGKQMANARANVPFEFVLMTGDNMYGGDQPKDFVKKFEQPYNRSRDVRRLSGTSAGRCA